MSTDPARCYYAYRPQQRPNCQLTATIAYATTTLCSACDQQRSTLGKALAPRRLPGAEPDPLALLTDANDQLNTATEQLTSAVIRARQHHLTWATIGTVLGTTRQAAQQRFSPP